MKPLAKRVASFIFGFALFAAGGAVATDVVEIPLPAQMQTQAEPESSQASPAPGTYEELVENPVYCPEIGKANELGGDCFCVREVVSDMAEVDCLIASGVVSADQRESYASWLSGEQSQAPTRSSDNPVFCWDIGKDDELAGDCFCVEGEVSDMAEVDCLIASGIVSADQRESYMSWLAGEQAPSVGRSSENPVFCWAIGKENELEGDCFCVEGEVSDMAEVDCLIASGIVSPQERETYESYLESRG